MKEIVIDFGNIVEEMENRGIKLCRIKKAVGWFLIDKRNRLYQIEDYYCGGYLDRYIKEKTKIKFNIVPESISNNIEDWQKEIRGIEEIKDFIDKQSKYWI